MHQSVDESFVHLPLSGVSRGSRWSSGQTDLCEYHDPPFLMDRPVLHTLVRELVDHEKVVAFADALPERARVSEAALPIVRAALHERLERPLVCVVPEDVDAADTADAVAW